MKLTSSFIPNAVAILLLLAVTAHAQTTYNFDWTGSPSRNWTTGNTWDPAITGGPVNGDSISISGGNATRLITTNFTANTTVTLDTFTYNDTNQVSFRGADVSGASYGLATTGNFTKQGSGELVFEYAINTSSNGRLLVTIGGDLNVSEGTLGFGTASSSSGSDRGGQATVTGLTTVSSGATLRVASPASAGNLSSFTGGLNLLGSFHVGRGANPSTQSINIGGLSGNGTISVPVDGNTSTTTTLAFTQSSGTSATFSGNITQGATNTLIGLQMAGTGRQIFSGNLTGISGAINFATGGSGVLQFNNANSFSSNSFTTIANGGIIGLGFDLSRNLGTSGAGNINWSAATAGGGFAAYGGDRTLTFNGGATLELGVTAGLGASTSAATALTFGHETSDSTIILTNAINYTANTRYFSVLDGSAAVDARFTGNLSGNQTFLKVGAGTLEWTGNSTRTGQNRVDAGVLIFSGNATNFGTTGNINANGGVIGLGNSDLTRAAGTGNGAIQLAANGSGFAAFGANRTVNLGNGTSLTWGTTTGFFSTSGSDMTLNVVESAHTLTFANNVALGNATRTITVGNGSAAVDARMTGVISGAAASNALVKAGAGTLEITNINTYGGSTSVNAGTLLVSAGSINSSTGVDIAGSSSRLRYDSTTGLTRNVTVTSGGTFAYNSAANYSGTLTFTNGKLEGTNWNGNLAGLSIGSNQVISPGNSPGTATTGSQTWAPNGTYLWEINDATGTAGVDPGWDLLNVTGALTLSSTLANPFTISITSLTLSNIAGNASNFADLTSYNWKIAQAGSAISGFSSDIFVINTSGFTNSFTGTFGIALGDSPGIGGTNQEIYLTYTAIPEPSTWALLGVGVAVLLWRKRRRVS
jgi:autotransporter-associated beta strand protein